MTADRPKGALIGSILFGLVLLINGGVTGDWINLACGGTLLLFSLLPLLPGGTRP